MIETFLAIMATNTVAQGVFAGALAAAPVTMALYLAKDVPVSLFNTIKKQISFNLTLLSDMDDYQKLVDKAEEHIFWSRSYVASYSEQKYSAGLGFGVHYGKYKGSYFRLNKKQEDSSATYTFKESATFTFFTRSSNVLLDFFNTASTELTIEDPKVYINNGEYWDRLQTLSPRPFHSVICKDKDTILQYINIFETSEADYLKKGIPYHMGILLSGPPGTGKTSLIHALALKTNRSVRSLNPTAMKKAGLHNLLSINWSDSILVLEDVDVSGAAVNRDNKQENMSLSELLNSLDGLVTPHGMITIATTNHLDQLDPALIRAGRFEHIVEIGPLDYAEALELAAIFEQPLPEPYSPMTGSDLRSYFLKNST